MNLLYIYDEYDIQLNKWTRGLLVFVTQNRLLFIFIIIASHRHNVLTFSLCPIYAEQSETLQEEYITNKMFYTIRVARIPPYRSISSSRAVVKGRLILFCIGWHNCAVYYDEDLLFVVDSYRGVHSPEWSISG